MKISSVLVWVFLWVSFPLHAAGDRNMLGGHPSPYLAMHGKDPVHWQTWGPGIFERARAENKPVFVSIGYFSCHWCHVMQRESYSNPEIAAYLNRHYIAVKVDRELQPALDAHLIDFVERTRGYSGWPLNVFITPEGYPLLGVVYLPPKNFKELLVNLRKAWDKDRAGLVSMAQDAAQAMQTTDVSAGEQLQDGLGKQYRTYLLHQAFSLADEMQGGFGEQNKFPMVPQLMALMDAYADKKEERLGRFLRLTLDRMAARGLRDHLRGGFFRYVVDPNWDIPHFEKMLYDNALMAELYMKAGDVFSHPYYHEVARDTLDFMLRELRTGEGAFIASLSAIDAQGREGGYYLWHDKELKKILSADEFKVLRLYWGMEHTPPLDDGHHPVLSMSVQEVAAKQGMKTEQVQRLVDSARQKLRKQQQSRSLPKDTKILASWNGLALSSFSKAARRYQEASYRKAAQSLYTFIAGNLWQGNELKRAANQGLAREPASLEDYAYVLRGMTDWVSMAGSDHDRKTVHALMQQAWKRFYSKQGWKLSETLLVKIGGTEPAISDGPMPSPSALVIESTLRMVKWEKSGDIKPTALRALNRGHKALSSNSLWNATHINVMVKHQSGTLNK